MQCSIQHIRRIWRCRMRECLHNHHHVQYLPNPQHACNLARPCPSILLSFANLASPRLLLCIAHTDIRRRDPWSLRKQKVQTIETRHAAVQTTQTPSRSNHLDAPTRRRWSAAILIACGPYTTTTSMTQQATSTTLGAQTTAATSLPSFDHSKLRLPVPNVTLPSLKQHLSAGFHPLSYLASAVKPFHRKSNFSLLRTNQIMPTPGQTTGAGMHVQKSGDSRARLHRVH
jgi:hypothetical protein